MTRPDQTRPDQTRPDQTRPDQTRPDQTVIHARNSSLELLRIVAMLMIVAHHFSVHSGFSFAGNSVAVNRLWKQILSMGGLGNDIFVMLSGYFLIKSTKVNFHKLFNLWLRMFFYSVVIYGLFVHFGAAPFSVKRMLAVMRPIIANQWWFPTTYFVLYLIHPYVNRFLLSFSREEYMKFLLTFGIYWSIIPILTESPFGADRTLVFVYLYAAAGYVRLHMENTGSRKYFLYGIAFIGLDFVYLAVRLLLGLKFPILGTKIGGSIFAMRRPFIILGGLCFLEGFRNLNIPYSKIINLTASAAFGVYLIHDNHFFRPFLWHKVLNTAAFQESAYFIPYSIAVILAVYISCTLIELLRSKVFRIISGGRLS